MRLLRPLHTTWIAGWEQPGERGGSGSAAGGREAGEPEEGNEHLVVLLDDILARVPTRCLQAGLHDPALELRFHVDELRTSIARGQVEVKVSRLAEICPAVFQAPLSALEDVSIRLPLQKLIEQLDSTRKHDPAEREGLASYVWKTRSPQIHLEPVGMPAPAVPLAATAVKAESPNADPAEVPAAHIGEIQASASATAVESSFEPPDANETSTLAPPEFPEAVPDVPSTFSDPTKPETPKPASTLGTPNLAEPPAVHEDAAAAIDPMQAAATPSPLVESPISAEFALRPPIAVSKISSRAPTPEFSEVLEKQPIPATTELGAVSSETRAEALPPLSPAAVAIENADVIETPIETTPLSIGKAAGPSEIATELPTSAPRPEDLAIATPETKFPAEAEEPKLPAAEPIPTLEESRSAEIVQPGLADPMSIVAPARADPKAETEPMPQLVVTNGADAPRRLGRAFPFASTPIPPTAPPIPEPAGNQPPTHEAATDAELPKPPTRTADAPLEPVKMPVVRLPAPRPPVFVRVGGPISAGPEPAPGAPASTAPGPSSSPTTESPPTSPAPETKPPMPAPSLHGRAILHPPPVFRKEAQENLGVGSLPEPASPQPAESTPEEANLAIPPLALPRFDQDALQAVFLTHETLDLAKIARLSGDLPGISGCLLLLGDETAESGAWPEHLGAAALRSICKRLATFAAAVGPAGAARAFTMHMDERSLTFFPRNGFCFGVEHSAGGFIPGVREKLTAIADGLAGNQ